MKVKWVVYALPKSHRFPIGTTEETFELELDDLTAEHYRGYYERIKVMRPGPERTALVEEVRAQMDMAALLDAQILAPEDVPEIKPDPGPLTGAKLMAMQAEAKGAK